MNEKALANQYAKNLANCRENIDRHWQKLSETPNDQQAHSDLAHDIHHLAGSDTDFGCGMLRDLASALAQALNENTIDNERQLRFIKGEVDQLLAVMDQAIEDSLQEASKDASPELAQETATPSTATPTHEPGLFEDATSALATQGTTTQAHSAQGDETQEHATQIDASTSPKKLFMSEHPRTVTQFIGDDSMLPHEKKVVYIIEDDATLAECLLSELGHFHYEARVIPDLKTLKSVMQKEIPNVAIVDVRMPDGKTTEFFKKVRNDYPDLPLIFTSAIDDIRSRVAAIEAGSRYFIKKPAEINRLVQLIDRLTQPHATDPIRVMIVPNNTEAGKAFAEVLYNAGCSVSIVDNPWRLFSSAEQLQPDVILLSATYQQCDGHTLAEALRQEDEFVCIPLLFMPDGKSGDELSQEGSIGSDGFLHDITAPDLIISEVISKAQHHRQLLDVIARDSLTDAYTNAAIIRQVHRDFHQAQLNDEEYSVAIIDIDDFRLVNERHGHNAGDRLLCRLTHFLRKHIRKDANIGRYGGEEFLLSLPDTTGNDALEQIDQLRQVFSDTCQIAQTKKKHTFSAGIADYPTYDSVSELLYYADQALYEAKRTGKNNVKQV